MAGIDLNPGATIGGEFRVVRPLASGGFGAVYVVEQASTGALRALKVLHARFAADPRSRERFVFEARASARIASDHVVEVVAAGVDEPSGTPWMVMELLDGDTLAGALVRRGCLPFDEAGEVFSQLGHALAAAHAVGVVHRDLKPENVVLATARRAGAPFTVKVLDFGIAKLLEERAGANTQALGSPRWMAPEQMTPGAPIGPATDVWSLGLLAYLVLTGRSYWRRAEGDNANPMALLVEIGADPIVPASERAAEQGHVERIPPGFDAWFARCVARPLNERFANAADATAALLPLLRAPRLTPTMASQPQPFAPLAPGLAPTMAQQRGTAVMDVTQLGHTSGPIPPMTSHAPPVRWGMPPQGATGPLLAPQPPRQGRVLGMVIGGALAALGLTAAGVGVGVYVFREPAPAPRNEPPQAPPQPPPANPPQAVMVPVAPMLTPIPPSIVPVQPVAAPAPAMPFQPGQRWVGGYTCAQGRTSLVLRITAVTGDRVDALFDFRFAPQAVHGVCEMHGAYASASRRLPLRPGAWVNQPPGYIAVGMDGRVSSDGAVYSGRMLHPSCGGFLLRLAR